MREEDISLAGEEALKSALLQPYGGALDSPAVIRDDSAAWLRLKGATVAAEGSELIPSRGKQWYWTAGIAVAALIIVAGARLIPSFRNISSQKQPHIYSTQRGQYAKLNLPDGSTVQVAPATTLTYSADFGNGNREITLHGGALFTVVNGDHPPFVVKTSNTSTRVLGTTFAIRKFAEDSAVTVTVAEGKVAVADVNNKSTVLGMGDQLQLGGSTSNIKRSIDISSALGWATGRLDFRDAEFIAVLNEVSRAYNLDLQVASERLGHRTVSGIIDRMSPSSVIDMLAAISGSRAVRSGNTITFEE